MRVEERLGFIPHVLVGEIPGLTIFVAGGEVKCKSWYASIFRLAGRHGRYPRRRVDLADYGSRAGFPSRWKLLVLPPTSMMTDSMSR